MKPKPTMTEAQARAYVLACEQLARMRDEMDALTGPPNRADLLRAIDLALAKNAAHIEEVFVDVMRGFDRLNPHAGADALTADVGASAIRRFIGGLGESAVSALILPLLKDQFRKTLSHVEYAGHDSKSMSDRRQRAAELKDAIAQLKRSIVPPQTPADWLFVEELAGAKLEIVRRIARAA